MSLLSDLMDYDYQSLRWLIAQRIAKEVVYDFWDDYGNTEDTFPDELSDDFSDYCYMSNNLELTQWLARDIYEQLEDY